MFDFSPRLAALSAVVLASMYACSQSKSPASSTQSATGTSGSGAQGAAAASSPSAAGASNGSAKGSAQGSAGSGGTSKPGTGGASGEAAKSGGSAAGAAGMMAMGVGGAGAAGASAAGAGGTTTPGTLMKECPAGSMDLCSSIKTALGLVIELGPYGSVMEANVGKGYENQVNPLDDNDVSCTAFADSFGEDPTLTAQLLDLMGLDLSLYTVYRPANWVEGEKYPIITWGNGTCAQPEGYGPLLRYVASYGFVVVAANSRYVGGATEMLHGLDFMFAANDDASSPYYHRLDTTKVGAMGHSQGAAGTANAASDNRVQYVILFNSGDTAVKPYLAISGDMDITGYAPADMKSAVDGEPKAAWLYYHMVSGMGPIRGHLTLMMQPERVIEPTTAWWKMMFNGDADSKAYFVGASCKLCNMTDSIEFGEHGLD